MRWYRGFKRPFLVIICILSISLVSLAGCARTAFVPPEYKEPLPPPTEVTVEQLSSEYFADEAAANAKYKGKRLLFNRVEVEDVGLEQFYQGGGRTTSYKTYFKSGDVKFKIKTQDLSLMQKVEIGYILNIAGTCLGLADLLKDYVTIDICWMESVKGDIGQEEVFIY